MMTEVRCPSCKCELELTAGRVTAGEINDEVADTTRFLSFRRQLDDYSAEQIETKAWSTTWAAPARAQLQKFLDGAFSMERQGVAEFRKVLISQGKSPKTTNTYLMTLSGFCRWLVNRGDLQENPCNGQALRRCQAPTKDQRLAFTPEEVRALLDYVWEFAPNTGFAGLVWAMAYTGARNEEVAQLRRCDIRLHKDYASVPLWVFDMADMEGGQSRKNEASRRLVPVHSLLLEELPKICSHSLQNGHYDDSTNLWSLSANASGRWAYRASKWVNQSALKVLKSRGKIRDDKRLSLYSLRHAVLTQLKHKGVSENLIAELAGHSHGNQTSERYGKRYPVEQLAEVVERLQW